MAHQFDHIHIKSHDPRKTARWWADHFGAELLPEFTAGSALFAPVMIGGVKINISSPGPADAPHMGEGDAGVRYGLEHLGLLTDDLDADLARLREQGLHVYDQRDTPGSRIAFVETPEGVRVELMQRLG
jgi:catechol 2,3-dioxygenase-like lactoylglutathione lyase family enzyme